MRGLSKEILLALVLLAFGLLGLPALVYLVGQRVIGPYGEDGSLYELYEALGTALAAGEPAAWTLVLSPYLIIQLFRATFWLHRRRPVT